MPIWILDQHLSWVISYLHEEADDSSSETGADSSSYDKTHYDTKTSTMRIKVRVSNTKTVKKQRITSKDPEKFMEQKTATMNRLLQWAKDQHANDQSGKSPIHHASRSRAPKRSLEDVQSNKKSEKNQHVKKSSDEDDDGRSSSESETEEISSESN